MWQRSSASSHLIRENIIERKNRRLKTEFFLNWEKNSSSHPTRHWFGTGLPGESGRLVPVAKNECKRGAMPGHPSCDAPKRHPRRSARNFRPSGKISKISPTDSSFPLQRRDLGVFGIKTQCRQWTGKSMKVSLGSIRVAAIANSYMPVCQLMPHSINDINPLLLLVSDVGYIQKLMSIFSNAHNHSSGWSPFSIGISSLVPNTRLILFSLPS